MYSYFDGYLQCCLVGKFMMIFSWPLELFSRVTKSVPEISFLERHASEYLRKLAGNAFLNCSAIPHQKISNVFMSINI